MKNLIKWLQENNFKFRLVTMSDGKNGVMIDTNYDGMYPTKETYTKHDIIKKKCSRLKGLITESRGFHTALLVIEA
jgi:hypothetical protein